MKNTLTVNHANNGSVDLVSRVNSGTNQLILNVKNGKGARISINDNITTVTTDDYELEVSATLWTGSGDFVFTIFDTAISYTITVHKIDELTGDIFINKISEYEYQLQRYIDGNKDYNGLYNQPQINSITLEGDKSAEDLGLATAEEVAEKVRDVEVNDASVVDENKIAHIDLKPYALVNMLAAYQRLLHAGDNITLTENEDGSFTISSEGGGSAVINYGTAAPTGGSNGNVYLQIEHDLELPFEKNDNSIMNQTSYTETASGINIEISGTTGTGNEYVCYKLAGLELETTYTISFDAQLTSEVTYYDSDSYQYGAKFRSEFDYNTSDSYVAFTRDNATHHYTLSLVADSDRAYFWIQTGAIRDGLSIVININNLTISPMPNGIITSGDIVDVWLNDNGLWIKSDFKGEGNMVYYGTGTPDSSIGENGDEYYKLNNSNEIIQKYIKLGSNWVNQSETPITLGTKTIQQNGTYNAIDDNLDGYDEVIVDVASAGGSLKYLVFAEQNVNQSNWTTGVLPLDNIVEEDSDYDEYLSYDSSTKKLTVLKEFSAIITFWVYNGWSSNQPPIVTLRVNDNEIRRVTATSSQASVKADNYIVNLNIGDTICIYNPASQGWGFGKLKIYSLSDGASQVPQPIE